MVEIASALDRDLVSESAEGYASLEEACSESPAVVLLILR